VEGADGDGGDKGWDMFIGRHKKAFVIFIAAALLAAVWAVLVLLWFVGKAQADGLVPETLDLWAMSHVVMFLLNLLFWMLVLVGIPVAVGAGIAWLWFSRLPADERREYRRSRNRSRRSDAGGGFSILVFIGFALKVYIDGNWDVPISTWTFNYLVYSWVTVLVWIFIIFAIPAAIGLGWWILRGRARR
jgi:hypothetical protein